MSESTPRPTGEASVAASDSPGLFRALWRSPATWALIGINVVVFVVEAAAPGEIIERYGQFGLGVAAGQYERLLSSAFVHLPGFTHIALNMLVLAVLGPAAESLLGRARFVGVYLLCALGGSALSYLLLDPQLRSVGASGAVYGLCGLVAVARPQQNQQWTSAVVVLLVLGLPASITRPVAELDWVAHLGGLITGAVLGAAIGYLPSTWRALRLGSVLATTALIAGVVAYQSTALGTQVRGLGGEYYVIGTQASCTGYQQADCASQASYGTTWTISDCVDQRCSITVPGAVESAALFRTPAGNWTATATRDDAHAGTCQGQPVPTVDQIDVIIDTGQPVPGVRGTVRSEVANTPSCSGGALSWDIVGMR